MTCNDLCCPAQFTVTRCAGGTTIPPLWVPGAAYSPGDRFLASHVHSAFPDDDAWWIYTIDGSYSASQNFINDIEAHGSGWTRERWLVPSGATTISGARTHSAYCAGLLGKQFTNYAFVVHPSVLFFMAYDSGSRWLGTVNPGGGAINATLDVLGTSPGQARLRVYDGGVYDYSCVEEWRNAEEFNHFNRRVVTFQLYQRTSNPCDRCSGTIGAFASAFPTLCCYPYLFNNIFGPYPPLTTQEIGAIVDVSAPLVRHVTFGDPVVQATFDAARAQANADLATQKYEMPRIDDESFGDSHVIENTLYRLEVDSAVTIELNGTATSQRYIRVTVFYRFRFDWNGTSWTKVVTQSEGTLDELRLNLRTKCTWLNAGPPWTIAGSEFVELGVVS